MFSAAAASSASQKFLRDINTYITEVTLSPYICVYVSKVLTTHWSTQWVIVTGPPSTKWQNVGKHGSIFVIFSLLNSERICIDLKLSPPLKPAAALPCKTLSGQHYSGTFVLATIIYVMSGSVCFMSFYLFISFFFLILTSLWNYCNSLFAALLNPFSYEDKRLAQH